jgi:hypothetical protein
MPGKSSVSEKWPAGIGYIPSPAGRVCLACGCLVANVETWGDAWSQHLDFHATVDPDLFPGEGSSGAG